MIEIHSAEFVTGAAAISGLPRGDHPEIAFAGRSNVGKSSLINMLLARRNLARTSSKPGKTRQINFYLINDAFHFVDLPGLGFAKVSRSQRSQWRAMISDYLRSRENLKLLFHLVDGRHPPMDADLELVDLYRAIDLPVVVLLTKTDKLSANGRNAAERTVREALLEIGLELPVVLTSSNAGRGREEVWRWIEDLAIGHS
ncbi:MAG: ribosome biogenesis GTP-binding protein YihA/YsxC [Rhodothermia bacterium]|nr:ribosome biogenesis GTP-binding protein YihA/YsxC [Rhodothermia bacterium]